MESVCAYSDVCLLSVCVYVAMALNVMGLVVATRLLISRMREDSIGTLQPA